MGVTVALLGQAEGPQAMAPEFVPAAWTCFFLMASLLSLDTVGRALVLPWSKVPCPLWGVDGGWVGEEVRESMEEEGRGTTIGM